MVKLCPLLARFRKPDDRSGRYRHGEGLGRPELLWDRLAIRFQSSDVDGDRLGRAFTTLVDSSALGETSWERGYQNHVAAGFLGLEHDGVRPHKVILSQGRSKLIGRDAGLCQDRPEKGWSDRLAGSAAGRPVDLSAVVTNSLGWAHAGKSPRRSRRLTRPPARFLSLARLRVR